MPRAALVGPLAACLVALCGASGCGATDNISTGPAAATTPATARSAGAVTPPASVVTAGVADNGHTLTLQSGQLLHVSLSSTYWVLADSSDPNVLREQGTPSVSPQPSGCVPGGGCGTASAVYVAVATGTARVTASRTSCGEAMGCTGSSGSWSLTIVVR